MLLTTAYKYYNLVDMSRTSNLGEFEHVVLLAILRLRRLGAYGVSIRAEIAERTQRNPAPGAIYTTLDRLEDKGLVASSMGEATPERGGRAKRYYRVTAQGMAALARAHRAFERMTEGLPAFGGGHG